MRPLCINSGPKARCFNPRPNNITSSYPATSSIVHGKMFFQWLLFLPILQLAMFLLEHIWGLLKRCTQLGYFPQHPCAPFLGKGVLCNKVPRVTPTLPLLGLPDRSLLTCGRDFKSQGSFLHARPLCPCGVYGQHVRVFYRDALRLIHGPYTSASLGALAWRFYYFRSAAMMSVVEATMELSQAGRSSTAALRTGTL